MSLLDPALARCMDAACQQRHKCLRWLERDADILPTTPRVATLRVFSGCCQGFLRIPLVESLPEGGYRIHAGRRTSTVSSFHLVDERIAQLLRPHWGIPSGHNTNTVP